MKVKAPKRFGNVSMRRVFIFCLCTAVVTALLLVRLGTLLDGLSASEVASHTAISWHSTLQNPLYLPLLFIRCIAYSLEPHTSIFILRLPSAILGLATIFFFWRVLRNWYGSKASLYGTALFTVSAWFLHVSRLATTEVVYLLLLPLLIWAGIALQRSAKKPAIFYTSLLLYALALYIPGAVWLVLASAAWSSGSLLEGWRQLAKWWKRLLAVLLSAIVVSPLIYSVIQTPSLVREWLGAPAHFQPVTTIAKNFLLIFNHLFIQGAGTPNLWLGKLPILPVFTSIVFIIGVYFYAQHWQAPRSRLILALAIISAALIALGGPVQISVIVPLVYIVAIAGIAYLLHVWLKIFPINPLARGLGIALVSIAVSLTCYYNFRQYFIAWPHNPKTKTAFQNRL